jgi:AcrR family transcriptional regulator
MGHGGNYTDLSQAVKHVFASYARSMSSHDAVLPPPTVADTDRRESVLELALVTFARFGYRKTSMEEVARAAHISRPGLYFLFTSKESLFRAAVTQALKRDIAAVERTLADSERPLRERLLESFDQWAGRYIGPMTREITTVIEDNPDLLGTIVQTTPRRFEELMADAISAVAGREAAPSVAQTLISTSIGIKHQVEAREAYLQRLAVAIDLILR